MIRRRLIPLLTFLLGATLAILLMDARLKAVVSACRDVVGESYVLGCIEAKKAATIDCRASGSAYKSELEFAF